MDRIDGCVCHNKMALNPESFLAAFINKLKITKLSLPMQLFVRILISIFHSFSLSIHFLFPTFPVAPHSIHFQDQC